MDYTKISRALLKEIKFHVMSDFERNGFMGCESPVCLIGDIESEGICVVIDGDIAELYAYDGCANFESIDFCENIRELAY